MKYWKVINRLAVFCLFMSLTACSTENAVVGSIGVSDVKSSGCKASASLLDSRPEYYNSFVGQKSVLRLSFGADNIVNGRFEDFMDNCAIDLFHVGVGSSEGKIILILYPDKDMLTNCLCRYDVDFKMQNIVSGNYQLEVYHTTADKQISKDNMVYSGTVNLKKGKEVVLTMSR
ncbi:hypothetical protein J5A56_06320 [Prevotella melaninogenica]|uniref:hypothetical protein n=1 Tax=Prevotella TaxID=838 RepID=UPI0003AD55E1|nr:MULTISPECIES: hypothetical protein [Prevotella]ERJ79091.1 hypothetical protein HMPREF9148_00642 [Prevotella sp. F0091]QUB74094.1 hypothetical protein J5A56_06320 [Prevotella melaninogenica]